MRFFVSRKAVRAAIFLLPLMGITHIIFFYYKFSEAWVFALWSYTAYFLMSFQGFFVAVLYCFLNGEVSYQIKILIRGITILVVLFLRY